MEEITQDVSSDDRANNQARAQLERNLTNHRPGDAQIRDIERVRDRAKLLGETIISRCPPSRERSLALTALEDTVMRAVQSIVTEGH